MNNKKSFQFKLLSFLIALLLAYLISPIFDSNTQNDNKEEAKNNKISENNIDNNADNSNIKQKTVPKEKSKNQSTSDDEVDSKSEVKDEAKDINSLVGKNLLNEEFDESGELIGWSSKSGLFYGMGSREGNRVLHIFQHLKPNPAKQKHSVFKTDEEGLIELLDEAWQKKDSSFTELQSNGNRVYDINMEREIGTKGEKKVRIVTKDGTSNIITAYPRR